ncbi:acetylornithine transaminase [Salimicrobium humidisoli]|uniref:Acetylornithine aminotransferase n=1 Tax=Salimicrobium humidisoli TaxID=2029857 RepID=A0ABX4HRD7_9BACI|nr:acetylornithine transaminase [Salimicrobium humidisoli]PBB05394.1 aspartate aminotransferase family protein [Salimicrobium humidisoli]
MERHIHYKRGKGDVSVSLFPTYPRLPVTLTDAEGTIVRDDDNNEYLDFTSGIGVNNLGHRPVAVQRAIEEQMNRLWHVSNIFPVPAQKEAAEILTAHSSMDAVFFCNSGAEANEAAIKLARKHTGKDKVVTFGQSFHGRSFATMAATGQEKVRQGFGRMLEPFDYAVWNDKESVEKNIDGTTAACMLEIVQGEGGVRPAEQSFLEFVQDICRSRGVLLIIDEIQTGAGRTGELFAYETMGLDPDIITSAKGLGSGFPVGAMLGKAFLKDDFGPGSHGSTFGGNPLSATAARATLEEILKEGFLNDVKEKGKYMKEQLTKMVADIDGVKEVRGLGLMIGVEWGYEVKPIIDELRTEGVLVLPAGPDVIRLLPPLTVTTAQIDAALRILDEVFHRKA